MSTPSSDTTTVEIDTQLLDALRAYLPDESARSLIESLVANELAVMTVREVRAEMRAERG
ncbi:hypothetical protein Q5424_00645 [Conexibacter sp. JD483]|uniref:hypothetical protein n=1 Tax=unclassified Conexibacter TaxID=2627773 RepID=UPI00271E1FF3|nr:MULTISPECIES: hypothetical protein [unclassified Conexibacter]MDO8184128.1 hypothetical protein [Conexibacter sp. CPCC 205706]MDO8197120.1 hypothetical protein [Conexibacter sp. CPCC 205762]MDR9367565.1 hypothetical protein [Conexibacter sp. JD483]